MQSGAQTFCNQWLKLFAVSHQIWEQIIFQLPNLDVRWLLRVGLPGRATEGGTDEVHLCKSRVKVVLKIVKFEIGSIGKPRIKLIVFLALSTFSALYTKNKNKEFFSE